MATEERGGRAKGAKRLKCSESESAQGCSHGQSRDDDVFYGLWHRKECSELEYYIAGIFPPCTPAAAKSCSVLDIFDEKVTCFTLRFPVNQLRFILLARSTQGRAQRGRCTSIV